MNWNFFNRKAKLEQTAKFITKSQYDLLVANFKRNYPIDRVYWCLLVGGED
jgi:hypothetical protein